MASRNSSIQLSSFRRNYTMETVFFNYVVLLPAILSLIDFHAFALSQGDVELRATDTTRIGIAEVSVVCENSDGKIVHQTKTDKTGRAIIQDLLEGTYTIFVEKRGYDSRSKQIKILAGRRIHTSFIMHGGGIDSRAMIGILPMKIRLGPPSDTDMFMIMVEGSLDEQRTAQIQFNEKKMSVQQFTDLIQSLGSSIWVELQSDVSYFQLISILDACYRLQRTEEVYLSLAVPEVPILPMQRMASPTTGLTIVVTDFLANNTERKLADARVEIFGPTSDEQQTDASGLSHFVEIQPGEYTVKVRKDEYQSETFGVNVQPRTMEILRFHLIGTDSSSNLMHSQPRLSVDSSNLKIPTSANIKMPDQPYCTLFLDRSKVAWFQLGRVEQAITSIEQLQSIFHNAPVKSLLIVADGTVDSRWIVDILKRTSAADFTSLHFVVQ